MRFARHVIHPHPSLPLSTSSFSSTQNTFTGTCTLFSFCYTHLIHLNACPKVSLKDTSSTFLSSINRKECKALNTMTALCSLCSALHGCFRTLRVMQLASDSHIRVRVQTKTYDSNEARDVRDVEDESGQMSEHLKRSRCILPKHFTEHAGRRYVRAISYQWDKDTPDASSSISLFILFLLDCFNL